MRVSPEQSEIVQLIGGVIPSYIDAKYLFFIENDYWRFSYSRVDFENHYLPEITYREFIDMCKSEKPMNTDLRTLRLMITDKCNLTCAYCCNNMQEVRSRFVDKKLVDIDFSAYKAVCITGGEPLLVPKTIEQVCNAMGHTQPRYLYTNGLLLHREKDHAFLFDGINIGIHYKEQMKAILTNLRGVGFLHEFTYHVQDIHKEEYLPNIPEHMIKTWTMNDCFNNINTEDWIRLV